jgi:predicted nucleic acid-binding protein
LSAAFVDTSVLIAMAFREPGFDAVAARLKGYDTAYACELLEAELRSACAREKQVIDVRMLDELHVVDQTRSLRAEIVRVLAAGYVRGADCFHLAVALSLAPSPGELTFLTLDKRQREVAATLGFAT